MNFNISLTACSTPNCTTERATAASIGVSDYFNTLDSSKNTNIYIAIGVSIVALGGVAAAVAFGINKLLHPTIEGCQQLYP